MTTICFYNHWHNGDMFSGKAYMWNFMTQYPGYNYVYAINSHPKIMQDLRCDVIPVNDLPDYVTYQTRGAYDDHTIYVNTWFGVYRHEVSPEGEAHANYVSLHKMWQMIYQKLSEMLHIHIHMPNNILQAAVAATDWSCYQIDLADKFVHACAGKQINLFCNGNVRSFQSDVADMSMCINQLAMRHVDQVFVVTQPIETACANVYFTNHIFQLDNDINEIAYLSTHAHLIVGKNSGPYMFCHVKDNLHDAHKTFWSLSQRPSDSYVYGVDQLVCAYYHSMKSETSDLIAQFDHIQLMSHTPGATGIMQVLT